MIIFLRGNVISLERSAERTRSRLSFTDASASPTISKEGRPFEASISTLTAKALSPSRPTLFIKANTLTSLPYGLI